RAGSTALVSLSGDRSLDDHLLALFFEFVHPQLPIISRTVFQDAYSRGRVPPLLVSAMGAAASVFLNRIETERKAIYEQYSQKVREHFHDACFEPSLEVVQTALIMTLCEYRNGSLHRAWVYLCKYNVVSLTLPQSGLFQLSSSAFNCWGKACDCLLAIALGAGSSVTIVTTAAHVVCCVAFIETLSLPYF
ncbi:hypothetical protein IWW41_003352, partial [Coemansia sp. RSA 2522]